MVRKNTDRWVVIIWNDNHGTEHERTMLWAEADRIRLNLRSAGTMERISIDDVQTWDRAQAA